MTSNVELLTPLLEAFPAEGFELTRDDPDSTARIRAVLDQIADPDFVCVMAGPDPTFKLEYRGADGFIEGWNDWLDPFDAFSIEVEDVTDSGDQLVTLVRLRARPKGSDAEMETAGGAVWSFRDGKLVRAEFHLDRDEALRAAGLAPGD